MGIFAFLASSFWLSVQGKSTLYKMAREGKTPAVKIAHQWRFRKDEIDEWWKNLRNKEILINK